jgi:hypothetical protein
MKQFKIIDFWVSVSIALTALICLPIAPSYAFMVCYFGVGAWQLLSMLVHFFNKWFTDKGSARYNYHCTVFVIILLALFGILLQPILWLVAIVMVFAAPIMILIYCHICYEEIKCLKRPLAELK